MADWKMVYYVNDLSLTCRTCFKERSYTQSITDEWEMNGRWLTQIVEMVHKPFRKKIFKWYLNGQARKGR